MSNNLVLGIDLGGTNCKFGIVDAEGRVINSSKAPTRADSGPEGVVEGIVRHAKELIDAGYAVKAVGMGCPGPMSARDGIIYQAPNLPGWTDVPLQKMMEERLSLPVALNNDANAAAYGEFWVGAGKDVDTMILITLGTGVGGGIILNDELYLGPDDTAGEIGHMIIQADGPLCNCGSRGCIEALVGSAAIRRTIMEKIDAGEPTIINIPEGAEDDFEIKVVYDAAVKGDKVAKETFARMGHLLGITSGALINLLNPEMIAFGGAVSNAGDYIFKPLRETAQKSCFKKPGQRARLVAASLGNDAGIIGAAGLAMKRYQVK